MPLDMTSAYNESYNNTNPAVADLGLGDLLKKDMADEDEKRKALMDKNTKDTASLTSGGIMSPATMALFGKGY